VFAVGSKRKEASQQQAQTPTHTHTNEQARKETKERRNKQTLDAFQCLCASPSKKERGREFGNETSSNRVDTEDGSVCVDSDFVVVVVGVLPQQTNERETTRNTPAV